MFFTRTERLTREDKSGGASVSTGMEIIYNTVVGNYYYHVNNGR